MWRQFVKIFFVAIIIEGTVRKILPEQPAWILLIKDLLLICAYSSFIVGRILKRKTLLPNIGGNLLWVVFTWFTTSIVLAILNSPTNIWLTLLGLRQYIFYFPAVLLGYYFFSTQNPERIRLTIYRYGLVIWLIFVVALIQGCSEVFGFSVPIALSVLEVHGKYHSSFFGPIFYYTSVFDVPERLASFSFWLLLLWQGYALSFGINATVAGSIVLSLLTIVLSGRRTGIILGLASVLLSSTFRIKRKNFLIMTLVLAVLAYVLAEVPLFNLRLKFARSTPAEELAARWQYNVGIADLVKDNYFGKGLSGLSQGAQYLNDHEIPTEFAYYGWREGILAKVAYELGLLGLLSYLAWMGYMTLIIVVRCLRSWKWGLSWRYLCLCSMVYWISILLWSVKGAQIFGDGLTSFLFWFTGGVALRLSLVRFKGAVDAPLHRYR